MDSLPRASQDSPRVRFLLIRSEENPATMAPIKAPSSRRAVRRLGKSRAERVSDGLRGEARKEGSAPLHEARSGRDGRIDFGKDGEELLHDKDDRNQTLVKPKK